MLRAHRGLLLTAALLVFGIVTPPETPDTPGILTVSVLYDDAPLPEVTVSLVRFDDSGAYEYVPYTLQTALDGQVSFTDLPTGTYAMHFRPYRVRYRYDAYPQWSGDVESPYSARRVVVAAGEQTVVEEELASGGYISGLVDVPRETFPSSRVGVARVSALGTVSPDVVWHHAGLGERFHIGPLRPGRYALVARTSTDGRIDQWWPGATTVESAGTVTVRANAERSAVDFVMDDTGGALFGNLTTVVDGAVVPAVTSGRLELRTRSGHLVAVSYTRRGYWSIPDIPAGSYLLHVTDGESDRGTTFAGEYWPDAATPAGARAVTVVEGDRHRIDIIVEETRTVAVTRSDAPVRAEPGTVLDASAYLDAPGAMVSYRWHASHVNGDGVVHPDLRPIPGATSPRLRVTESHRGTYLVAVATVLTDGREAQEIVLGPPTHVLGAPPTGPLPGAP